MARVIGFKVIHWRLTEQVHRYIEDNSVLVIHLIRRNLLNALISQELAGVTNVWHTYSRGLKRDPHDDIANYNAGRIEITVERARNFFRKREQETSEIEARHRTLRIYYEDLPELSKVHDYLGTDKSVELVKPSTMLRLRKSPKEKVVANYEELRGAFANSKYAWMF
jgi:LPS sulfotransferase NodH